MDAWGRVVGVAVPELEEELEADEEATLEEAVMVLRGSKEAAAGVELTAGVDVGLGEVVAAMVTADVDGAAV